MPNPSELRRNRLLDGLGDGDFTRLRANLKNVRLTRGEVLHPVGVPIKHVYFPESGMVSLLTVMKSGELIETAIVGREGVAGGWVAIDGRNANTQSTVQIEGSALQNPTAKFLEINKASDSFQPAIKGVILFQATKRGLPRYSLHRVAHVPLALALAGRYGVGPNSTDARISVSHAWSSKDHRCRCARTLCRKRA